MICRASRTSLRIRSRASGPVEMISFSATGGLQDEIVGPPHVAHAAAPDALDHPVAAREHLARHEDRLGARTVPRRRRTSS